MRMLSGRHAEVGGGGGGGGGGADQAIHPRGQQKAAPSILPLEHSRPSIQISAN